MSDSRDEILEIYSIFSEENSTQTYGFAVLPLKKKTRTEELQASDIVENSYHVSMINDAKTVNSGFKEYLKNGLAEAREQAKKNILHGVTEHHH